MQNVLSPLMGVYQTQLEASRRFADAIFSGTEKIDRVVIGATQRVFNDQLNLAQALTSLRDPQSVSAALQSGLMAANQGEAMNYQKEILRIFAEMQNEIGKSMQDYVDQMRRQASNTVPNPVQNLRERAADNAFNPVTSMFSVWESAFKEVAALAKNNMTTARSNMEAAANRAVQTSANMTDVATGRARDAAHAMENAASMAADMARHATAEDASPDDRKGGSSGSGKKK